MKRTDEGWMLSFGPRWPCDAREPDDARGAGLARATTTAETASSRLAGSTRTREERDDRLAEITEVTEQAAKGLV